MNALSAALALAQRGLAVFPCVLTKRPACSHGFKDATSDPAGVRELWRRFPGELVGVPTGNRNKFAALDVDPRHGGQHTAPDTARSRHRGHSLWSTAGGCRTTEAAETLARGVGGAHDLFDIRGRDTVPGCSRQYGVFP
jgi:hypothetical protein